MNLTYLKLMKFLYMEGQLGVMHHISFKENFNNTEEYVKFENNDFKLFSNETYIRV